jgi:hypothetical protein
MINARYKLWLPVALLAIAIAAQAQIAQPYLTSTSPNGARRGGKVTFTIEGFNLTDASEVIWNKPGITSSIVLNSELAREEPRPSKDPTKRLAGDRGTRNRLTIETTIAPGAPIGVHSYRIRTSLGTTNLGRIYVGALPETKERETNDSVTDAQLLLLPVAVVGEIQKIGDADHFKFKAKAGQQLVFEVISAALNSKLDSFLTLLDDKGQTLASNNDFNASKDSLLAYRFKQDGEFVIRISDLERRGQTDQYEYRLNLGEFPYVTSVFPLGVRQGATSEVAVNGFNLDVDRTNLSAATTAGWGTTAWLNLKSPRGETFNNLKLAVGRYPEMMESAAHSTLASPQTVAIPSTINGRIFNDRSTTDEDFYRFRARKGQRLVLEIEAQRYGSPLDAVIEVLDAKGNQIPRIIARCLLETQLTLNDRDSANRGFRLLNWNGIHVNDYLLAGNELVQVDVLPKGPDEDTFFKSFLGQRLAFEDTTPEAHAVNSIAYKVSLHPPDLAGAKLAPNGLPVVTIYHRNDDGGPMYGKDSRLNFVAPADGEYLVRIRDVRGMQDERFAYRLSIHEPAPDLVLFADPENPNIPRGSSLPITVTAFRVDGLDGDINVKLLDLPVGFSATESLIRSGQNSTVIVISAANDATAGFPLRVQATATANGRTIARELKTEERLAVVSVAPEPELLVWTEPSLVVLEPGGHAFVTIRVKRERGFEGRIPFDVRNLPHGVIVTDVGLNGVMITEEETTQRFRLAAESWVKPMEQPVVVVGRIETASPQRSDFPAKPFTLIIRPKESATKSAQK